MNKLLIVPLEHCGFGAGISRRIVLLKYAEQFGRQAVFVRKGHLYEDPYKGPAEIAATATFNYTDQPDQAVLFDTQDWFKNHWRKDKALRTAYEDGRLLSTLQLKPVYEQDLTALLERHPELPNSIALHIRRGDKITEEPYVSMDKYIEVAKICAKELGLSNFYINSDSEAAILEAKQRLNALGFQCTYEEQDRYDKKGTKLAAKGNWFAIQQNPSLRSQETRAGIQVIYSMARCQHIIGNDRAQFSRLASFLLTYTSNSTRGATLINGKTQQIVYSSLPCFGKTKYIP